MKKAKSGIRAGFLVAAACFLWNPNVEILDVLPDFIAYLLLYAAIADTRRIVPHMEEACRGFLRMAVLTAVKIPAWFVMSSAVGGKSDDLHVLVTLFTLVFGILECIFALPALREFFTGLDYANERFGAFAGLEKESRRAERATYLLTVVKPVLALLPELSYLFTYDSTGHIRPWTRELASFRPLLVVFCATVCLGVGIYFLVSVLPYFRAIGKDPVAGALFSAESDAAPLESDHARRARYVRFALIFLTVAALCRVDLYFDGINYLPSFLGIAAILVALFFLRRVTPRYALPAGVSAVLALVFSAVTYALRAAFFSSFTYASLGKSPRADTLYRYLCVASAAEAVCTVLLFALLFVLLSVAVSETTGTTRSDDPNGNYRKELHRTLRRRALAYALFGALASLSATADIFLTQITQKVSSGNEDAASLLTVPVFGWVWMVTLIFAVLHLIAAFRLSPIGEEAAHKAAYEG